MSNRVMIIFVRIQALYKIGIYSFSFKIVSISAIVIGSILPLIIQFYEEANKENQTGVKKS